MEGKGRKREEKTQTHTQKKRTSCDGRLLILLFQLKKHSIETKTKQRKQPTYKYLKGMSDVKYIQESEREYLFIIVIDCFYFLWCFHCINILKEEFYIVDE